MNKAQIFLSGGGDPNVSFEFDKKFFSSLPFGAKILYIPVALNRTREGFEQSLSWFKDLVKQHAQEKEIAISMQLEEQEVPELTQFDAVFLGGGNTYKLLEYIRKSGLDNKLVDFLKKKGIIYGGSAGAIVLGKDISVVRQENDNNYNFNHGLNLIEGKSILCHYSEKLDQAIMEDAESLEIMAISEEGGLILDSEGKILEIVGNVYFFAQKSKKQL